MIKQKEHYINKSIFITGTNTNVGKTFASEKFLKYFSLQGLRVGYFKPCETGVKDLPLDGTKVLKLVKSLNPSFKASINDIVPYQFKLSASPFVAKGDMNININHLLNKKKYLESMCDVLIIEGAGGLMVPLEEELFIIDLIKIFKSETFLITPSKLGCINDTLLSIEALKNRNIDFDIFINLYEDKENFEKISLPFLKNYFKKLNYLHEII